MNEILRHTEGLLFLSGSNGITIGELIKLLSTDQDSIEKTIAQLNATYSKNNHAFHIISTASTYKLVTLGCDDDIYKQYADMELNDKITPATMETLAIIAYNQPISRFNIEETRGAGASYHIRSLIDKDLVKIVGKSKEIGKPNIYGTTTSFLDYIGINSLDNLPSLKDFIYEIQNSNEDKLFDEVDDFKEIRKRMIQSKNIVSVSDEIDFSEIDQFKVPTISIKGDNDDTEITEANSPTK